MAEEFTQTILLRVVAQICQMIGFSKVISSPLYILGDILRDFIRDITRLAQHYAEHCGRSVVTVSDLSMAFHDFGIYPVELLEFLQLVSPLPGSLSVPRYPVGVHSLNRKTQNVRVLPSETGIKIKISLKGIKEENTSKAKKTHKVSKDKIKKKKNEARDKAIKLALEN